MELAATWFKAVTLAERIKAWRTTPGAWGDDGLPPAPDSWQAQQWRVQPPFATPPYLAQRIAGDGLTEDEFFYLLNESPTQLRARLPVPPAWLETLHLAYAQPRLARLQAADAADQPSAPFLAVIEPLIAQAQDRLSAGLVALWSAYLAPPFDPSTVEAILWQDLPTRLPLLLSRTLVLELHLAGRLGALPGDTPEARFAAFIARLTRPAGALALFEEYPLLARQLTLVLDQWVAAGLEFLARLCADWPAIRDSFSPGTDPGGLVRLEHAGDPHRGGRQVYIAHFASGLRVVFKPRSVAVDAHFQELLSWLNARGWVPVFRPLGVLDRGTHGWVEFAARQDCTTPAEVTRFYTRQGGYLALLYALKATDCHYENLVAAGEHPMLIDLETLFHPALPDVAGVDTVDARLESSVLRVGLLPWRTGAGAVDVGGLSDSTGQMLPNQVVYWEGAGTDRMRLAHKDGAWEGSANAPRMAGAPVRVADYVEAVTQGFTAMYGLLEREQEALLADDGPLAGFAGDAVRCVLRHTRLYSLLLFHGFHPDMLRDALRRERFFDHLWAEIPHRPHLARVVAAERADLHNNDIPYFSTRPDSPDLWTSTGQCLAGFFAEPGLAAVRRQVAALGPADRDHQLRLVHGALATLTMGEEAALAHTYPQPAARAAATPTRLLEAARAVGDHLERVAVQGADDATWVGLTLTPAHQWTLAPLAADLYEGLAGVTLFLAYLGAVSGEARYTALARRAWVTTGRLIATQRDRWPLVGGFTGWGGIIYTLAHLDALWPDAGLRAEAAALVELLPPLIAADTQFDMLAGAAGCIGGLLSLYRRDPAARTLEVAVQCGERLLAAARPQAAGIGWMSAAGGALPLAGFAHGAAGIACALGALAAASGQGRFADAAAAALAYERTLFVPEAGNWRDLRPGTHSVAQGLPMFWCNGAAGIGLGRLCMLAHNPAPAIRAEIAVALETTLAQGFGRTHSLCHGDLGNLELLLTAGQVLDHPYWQATTWQQAGIVLESIATHGWLCGVPRQAEVPGLLTGLAGIGYELLRLAAPDQVPSVLTLEAPVAAGVTKTNG